MCVREENAEKNRRENASGLHLEIWLGGGGGELSIENRSL